MRNLFSFISTHKLRLVLVIGLIIGITALYFIFDDHGSPDALRRLTDFGDGDIQDGELDLTDAELIKARMQSEVDDSYVNFRINTNPVLTNKKVNWMIQNSERNKFIIQIEIIGENGELIYMSPALKPNQRIQEDYFETQLPPGNHNAVAMFNFYDIEDLHLVGQTGVRITLTIQG